MNALEVLKNLKQDFKVCPVKPCLRNTCLYETFLVGSKLFEIISIKKKYLDIKDT